jgi:hypothetical protein
LIGELNVLTARLMLQASKDKEVVSSAANDFLMFNGYYACYYYSMCINRIHIHHPTTPMNRYLQMGYQWLKMAATAQKLLDSGNGSASKEFYQSKLHVRFEQVYVLVCIRT